jgi:hypothetical protein
VDDKIKEFWSSLCDSRKYAEHFIRVSAQPEHYYLENYPCIIDAVNGGVA